MNENLVPMIFEAHKLIQVNQILFRRKLRLNADDIVVLHGKSSCGGRFEVTEFCWPLKSEGLRIRFCKFQMQQETIYELLVL